MNTEKGCKTCTHYKKSDPEDGSGWCLWPSRLVPVWVDEAAGYGYNAVYDAEGADCSCWQIRGEE